MVAFSQNYRINHFARHLNHECEKQQHRHSEIQAQSVRFIYLIFSSFFILNQILLPDRIDRATIDQKWICGNNSSSHNNATLPIQGANCTQCCNKQNDFNILHDICERQIKCCVTNFETTTAISYGYDNVEEDEKYLEPTVSSDNVFYIETSGVRSLI